MSEIRSLRLIVNNSPALSKYAVDGKQFPENGSQIMRLQSDQSVITKLSTVSKSEKIPPEKKDPKRKEKKEKRSSETPEGIDLHI